MRLDLFLTCSDSASKVLPYLLSGQFSNPVEKFITVIILPSVPPSYVQLDATDCNPSPAFYLTYAHSLSNWIDAVESDNLLLCLL